MHKWSCLLISSFLLILLSVLFCKVNLIALHFCYIIWIYVNQNLAYCQLPDLNILRGNYDLFIYRKLLKIIFWVVPINYYCLKLFWSYVNFYGVTSKPLCCYVSFFFLILKLVHLANLKSRILCCHQQNRGDESF